MIQLAAMGGLATVLSGAAFPSAAATPAGGALAAPSGPRTEQAGDTDRAALAQLYKRQAEAWARGDAKAYAATYTPDADFVNVTGEYMHTRAEIAERYEGFLHKQLKNSRIHTIEERIDMVTPSIALIVRKGCVFYGAETTCHPNTLSVNSSMVVKKAGQWLVRSFHNTLIDEKKIQPRTKTASSTPAGNHS